jgi:hypothetical protein
MAAGRKSKAGVGVLLILMGGCSAARWQSANLQNGGEAFGYFSFSIALLALGIWLIFRKTGQQDP